jgi:methyltransferase (TIGR00027 family)
MDNMTALVSCFARCYHTLTNGVKIFDDIFAQAILSSEEYEMISSSMSKGIGYFNPNYSGDDPLNWIVNHQLAPSVLARSILTEDYVQKAQEQECIQYVILASGYDTSAYKLDKRILVFELDKADMIEDKIRRIQLAGIDHSNVRYVKCDFTNYWIDKLLLAGFDSTVTTVISCLGISYYLDKKVFEQFIRTIAEHIPNGSLIVFDYPNMVVTDKEIINQEMAKAVNEEMKSTYSISDLHQIIASCNLKLHQHLNHSDMDRIYFQAYNSLHPKDEIHCPEGVSYGVLMKVEC